MPKATTFFEQVSVETVKKICQLTESRRKKKVGADELTIKNPVKGIDPRNPSRPGRSRKRLANRGSFSMADSPMTDSPTDDLTYPEWQKPLQEALLEFDNHRLKERIATAEAAIANRLQVLAGTPNCETERQAIQDAVRLLAMLKERPLGLPDAAKEPV